MGLFNSKKEQNKYTAIGTYPYTSDQVIKAINMGVGYPLTFDNWSKKFVYGSLLGDDITIQAVQVSYSQTQVKVEASMHIGAAKFAGINMEAWGNKNNAQKVMDRIIANLKRL